MPKLSPLLRLAREHGKKRGKEPLSPTGYLKNDIHPLFAREKFDSDINYDALKPGLQLVTRLLDTPQMHHYFYVIFFGQTHDLGLQDREGRDLREIRSDNRIHMLTDQDVAEVRRKLVGLAEMLTIGVSDLPPNVRAAYSPVVSYEKDGHSYYQTKPRFSILYGLPGCEARIKISRRWYEEILNLQNTYPAAALTGQFIVAEKILHELAHAADGAAFHDNTAEKFFQDNAVNEAGSQATTCMFGSGNRGTTSAHTLILEEWPNKIQVDRYEERVPYRDPIVTCRDQRGLPHQRKKWILPLYFVQSLFSEWFWQEMGKSIDARALIPEPLAQSIRKALRGTAHTRMPAPQSVADLFEHAAELRGAVLHPSDVQQSGTKPVSTKRKKQTSGTGCSGGSSHVIQSGYTVDREEDNEARNGA